MIIFATIKNITFENSVHFKDGTKIEKFEHSIFNSPLNNELIKGLGGYYFKVLENKDVVIAYKEFDSFDYKVDENEFNLFVVQIIYFLSMTWYLKANAFQLGRVWLFNEKNKTLKKTFYAIKSSPLSTYKGKSIFLSNQDVDSCLDMLHKFLEFNFETRFDLNDNSTDYSKLSILQRAAQLIEYSKFAEGAYQKIGLLCSAMECLFTTDAAEVSHKVAERLAFFIAENSEERVGIFSKIKKAYSLRSSFFHGNKLRNITDEEYYEFENIIRKVMKKIFFVSPEPFLEKPEKINEYFINLVLGRK